MKASIKGFIYHKTSERFSDCYDRYGINTGNNKFAVSDGVSKSFFPESGAELLVDSFINTKGKINLTDTEALKVIQKEWVERVGDIVSKPNQKYFVRNAYAQGKSAAATFVGLHFFDHYGKYKWEAFAIGDSFMFFVPEGIEDIGKHFNKIIYLSSKKDFEFDNFPDFFDSRSKVNKGKIKPLEHDLKAGTFYIMTDALSQWFISEKQVAVKEINSWYDQVNFEKSVNRLRNGNLQNDDVAILIIRIEEDGESRLRYNEIIVTDLKKLLKAEENKIEKEQTEWAPIEKQLLEEYEKEKLIEENILSEKYETERIDHYGKFSEYLVKGKTEARNRLKKRHEDELENFERQWERQQEREKIDLERQFDQKLEAAKIELTRKLKIKYEEMKLEKKKQLAQRNERQTSDNGFNIINDKLSKEDHNRKSHKNEAIEDNNSVKVEVNKKKGFWESTKEIGSKIGTEAVDAVTHIFQKKDTEDSKSDINSIPIDHKKRVESKISDDDTFEVKEKKRPKRGEVDNDDVTSITDKF